jgi:hypothetical protein
MQQIATRRSDEIFSSAPSRLCVKLSSMTDDLQKRIQAALANPQNMARWRN